MAQIPRFCGCGVGWWLQLLFDPSPGNLHMPREWSKKWQKDKKKKKKVYTFMTKSLCYRAEIGTTLEINYALILKKYILDQRDMLCLELLTLSWSAWIKSRSKYVPFWSIKLADTSAILLSLTRVVCGENGWQTFKKLHYCFSSLFSSMWRRQSFNYT